jgi:hypothetical protein
LVEFLKAWYGALIAESLEIAETWDAFFDLNDDSVW